MILNNGSYKGVIKRKAVYKCTNKDYLPVTKSRANDHFTNLHNKFFILDLQINLSFFCLQVSPSPRYFQPNPANNVGDGKKEQYFQISNYAA